MSIEKKISKILGEAVDEVGSDVFDDAREALLNDLYNAVNKICKDHASKLNSKYKGKLEGGSKIKSVTVDGANDLELEDFIFINTVTE